MSAETGEGIDSLLETLALTAEIHEFKADFSGAATGSVIESRMEEGRGATANILVQQGEPRSATSSLPDARSVECDITNDRGERSRPPALRRRCRSPASTSCPTRGQVLHRQDAQACRTGRRAASRGRPPAQPQPKLTLDSMFASMDEQATTKELLVVLKADVQGSIDAIKKSIEEVSTDEIKIRVLHAAVGGITESDVTLASASGAIVFGFNVIPSARPAAGAE